MVQFVGPLVALQQYLSPPTLQCVFLWQQQEGVGGVSLLQMKQTPYMYFIKTKKTGKLYVSTPSNFIVIVF